MPKPPDRWLGSSVCRDLGPLGDTVDTLRLSVGLLVMRPASVNIAPIVLVEGLDPESEEGLDILGNMLWVIFDASLMPEWVSTSRIANAYYDFRRAVLRKDAAVQEAFRAGAQDFSRYGQTGDGPAGLANLLKVRREPAARTLKARRA